MRIILAVFDDRFEAYTSLKPFFDAYPDYERYRENINTYLSRKKQPYENDDFKLIRIEVR